MAYVRSTISRALAIPHYKRVIIPVGGIHNDNNQAPGVGNVYLRPFEVEYPLTVDEITLFIINAAGNIIQGIYDDGPAGDTPEGGAVLAEHASLAAVGGGQSVALALTALEEGLYWVAFEASDNAIRIASTNTNTLLEANSTLTQYRYARGGGYGALTDPCPVCASPDLWLACQLIGVAGVP